MGCPLAVHGGSPPGGYPGWPDGALIRRPGKLSSQQRVYASPQAAYRSGLEEKTCAALDRQGVPYRYEHFKVGYTVPASKHTYLPDILLRNGIVIELKGLWTTEDRKKHRLIRAQHPDLDVRMVFSNAQARIAKKSPTTYAKFAETHGMLWAHKTIPEAWLSEGPNMASIDAMRAIGAWPWS